MEKDTPRVSATLREPTQETFISDLSSYDREAQYVGPSKRGSTVDEEEEEEEGEEEHVIYPGPTAWEDVDQGELNVAADHLVRVFAKVTDEEDALLRQVAAAAAALDDKPRDPLGLGIIDINTLKLSTEDFTSSISRKFTTRPTHGARSTGRSQKQKAQDAEKILPSGAAFSPELYLSTVHENSSLSDLEDGMQALETELSKRTGQLKKLVRENFERFISCKNTIDDVYVRLRRNEADKRGVNTQSLRTSISQVQDTADRAFAPMLERNQKLQQIKNVMGVIKRFQSIFGLPARIRQLEELQDYSQVVTEYKRAKAMMAGSEVSTWISLFSEVEKGVSEVCSSIVESLENPDLEPQYVEEFSTHVMQFQNEGLPSAQGIQPVGLWLASLEHHTHDEISAATRKHLANLAKVRDPRRKPSPIRTSAICNTVDATNITGTPHQCWADHVTKLCQIVLKYVPAAWTIGKSSNLKEVPDSNPTIQSTIAASLKGADRVCQGILESFSLKVMESVEALISDAGLLPSALFSILKTLRSMASDLMINKGPPLLISTLQSLLKECHRMCGNHLCTYLHQQMEKISEWEDWVVTIASRNAGIAVTAVPSKLCSAVRDVMDQHTVLTREREQHPPTSEGDSCMSLQASFYECFELFAAAVQKQADSAIESEEIEEPEKSAIAAASQVTSSAKLLVLLGNCRYIRKQVLSDLASEYSDALATDNPFVTNEVPKITLLESSFEELEEQLVDTYVGTVASGLKIMVRKAIEDEKVNPPKPIELIGISDCPIEWIHYLMEVQAEVYEFSPAKLHVIMDPTVLCLVNAVQSRSHHVSHLGYHIQMYMDLCFLEASLKKYQSQRLDDAWDLAYENLIGQITNCLADSNCDLGSFHNKLDIKGDAIELDKQLQSICRDVLQDVMERMGTNISCLGTTG